MTDEKVLQAIQGTWEVDEGYNQGKAIDEDNLDGVKVVIKEKVIVTYDRQEKELYRANFTVDASKSPIAIDMETDMPGMPATKAEGILKFDEEDEWVLCYGLPGQTRPASFDHTKSHQAMIFELEKED